MYKIIGIGKNDIRIELANKKEVITFPSQEDAQTFINKLTSEGEITDGYQLVVEKINQ
ncbi:hypothetical protein [Virgibacillus necropolis]|uniref:hypothetical protein n=1 Tax=Virgibacillus necropolis TaxID=163877 RepID=UPI001374715E|nr:hypothetical protein [Virgibacillus necropolis]